MRQSGDISLTMYASANKSMLDPSCFRSTGRIRSCDLTSDTSMESSLSLFLFVTPLDRALCCQPRLRAIFALDASCVDHPSSHATATNFTDIYLLHENRP